MDDITWKEDLFRDVRDYLIDTSDATGDTRAIDLLRRLNTLKYTVPGMARV